MRIGFVGLGVMGAPMASHLASAGHQLKVWNRTAEKARDLVALGAIQAKTPAEAADGADAVMTMLADDAALRDVTLGDEGLLNTLPRGAVHVSMGTVSGKVTADLAAAHTAHGSALIAAPVFGSKESAVTKKLWGIASGPPSAVERCRPALEAMTQSVKYLGPDPATAANMKIICNSLISGAVAGMVQAFATGAQSGVSPAQIMDVIRLVFNSPVYERYGSRLVERNFAVHFPLKLMLKDISLMIDMGMRSGVPLPHASATRDMLVAGVGQGFGDEDAAGGLMRAWERVAGM